MNILTAVIILAAVIIVCITAYSIALLWYDTKVLEKAKTLAEYEDAVKPPEKPKERKVIQDPNEEIEEKLY